MVVVLLYHVVQHVVVVVGRGLRGGYRGGGCGVGRPSRLVATTWGVGEIHHQLSVPDAVLFERMHVASMVRVEGRHRQVNGCGVAGHQLLRATIVSRAAVRGRGGVGKWHSRCVSCVGAG